MITDSGSPTWAVNGDKASDLRPEINWFPHCRPPCFIERRTSPSCAEFEQQYLAGVGRPVILTDVVPDWPASRNWTFEFFRKTYGEDEILACDRLFSPQAVITMKMKIFAVYCQYPDHPRFSSLAMYFPLYAAYKPFTIHPELLGYFSQPSIADTIYTNLGSQLEGWHLNNFGVMLIGPRGTVSPMHVDKFGTHAWLASLCGRKHFVFFSPEDAAKINHGRTIKPDINPSELSVHAEAQPFEAIVGPGDLIVFPQGWYHQVVALDPSISLSFNFVNKTNCAAHVIEISRDLETWMKRIDGPEFKAYS